MTRLPVLVLVVNCLDSIGRIVLHHTEQHQSAGFLDINTQLSMERRRFILDAITHCPSQSIADELSELRRSHQNTGSNSVPLIASGESSGAAAVDTSESRSKRAAARQHKLAALKHRHQVEVRFQALEKVFGRNSSSKVRTHSAVEDDAHAALLVF